MLGRLRMSVYQAIDAYRTLAESIFDTEITRWLDKANPAAAAPRVLVGETRESLP
jgi:hypothetical protein